MSAESAYKKKVLEVEKPIKLLAYCHARLGTQFGPIEGIHLIVVHTHVTLL